MKNKKHIFLICHLQQGQSPLGSETPLVQRGYGSRRRGRVCPAPTECPPTSGEVAQRGWFPPARSAPHWLACLGGAGSWLGAEATLSRRISPSPCLLVKNPRIREFDFQVPRLDPSPAVTSPRMARFVCLEGACWTGCCLSRAARDALTCSPGKAAL